MIFVALDVPFEVLQKKIGSAKEIK